jgi:hypothetical protein
LAYSGAGPYALLAPILVVRGIGPAMMPAMAAGASGPAAGG